MGAKGRGGLTKGNETKLPTVEKVEGVQDLGAVGNEAGERELEP
jgi:hypothetical protein